jgi:hypothetical protein
MMAAFAWQSFSILQKGRFAIAPNWNQDDPLWTSGRPFPFQPPPPVPSERDDASFSGDVS